MATRDPLNALHVPGFLVKDPSNLSAASPYGGTILGTTGRHVFKPGFRYHAIAAEEWGNAPCEMVYLGEAPVFGAVLRSWDDDAISALFPLSAAGSSSGARIASHDVNAAATRAGTKLSSRAHKLLFVPESVRTQPAVYLPNAVPVVDGDAAVELQRNVMGAIACMWVGLPDSNGITHRIGRLEDMTL